MLRKIVIIKKNKIIYKRDYGETFSWEAISPLFVSLTYFLEETTEDVAADIMQTVFYKIAYSTNKKLDLLFLFVSDISDSDETLTEQIQRFNVTVSEVVEDA